MYGKKSQRDLLMEQLMQKTEELQRQVTSQDMLRDAKMANPNSFAFYWRSFDEAAAEAWLRVQKQQNDAESQGGAVLKNVTAKAKIKEASKNMEVAKKTKQEWLDWVLQVGEGKLPNYVTLKNNHPEEVSVILKDFGNWHAVELMFAEQQKRLTENALAPDGADGLAKAPEVKQEEPEVAKSALETNRRERINPESFTEVEAAELVLQMQKDLGLSERLPSQSEINNYSKQHQTASYMALAKRLGPKEQWPEVIARVLHTEQPNTKQTGAPMEEPPMQPLVDHGGEPQVVVAPHETENDDALVRMLGFSDGLARALGVGSIKLLDVKLTVERKGERFAIKVQKIG